MNKKINKMTTMMLIEMIKIMLEEFSEFPEVQQHKDSFERLVKQSETNKIYFHPSAARQIVALLKHLEEEKELIDTLTNAVQKSSQLKMKEKEVTEQVSPQSETDTGEELEVVTDSEEEALEHIKTTMFQNGITVAFQPNLEGDLNTMYRLKDNQLFVEGFSNLHQVDDFSEFDYSIDFVNQILDYKCIENNDVVVVNFANQTNIYIAVSGQIHLLEVLPNETQIGEVEAEEEQV